MEKYDVAFSKFIVEKRSQWFAKLRMWKIQAYEKTGFDVEKQDVCFSKPSWKLRKIEK